MTAGAFFVGDVARPRRRFDACAAGFLAVAVVVLIALLVAIVAVMLVIVIIVVVINFLGQQRLDD